MGACVYGRNPTGRFMVILLDVAECLKDKQNGKKKRVSLFQMGLSGKASLEMGHGRDD